MARRISSRRLVGREGERTPLWAAIERARAGDPSVTIVIGEAGIGKSRLLRDVEQSARADGMLVVAGDCLELDGGEVPYAPMAAALRDLPAAVAAEVRAALPRRGWVELVRAFPALGSEEDDRWEPTTEPDRFAQARLFEFLLAMLRILSNAAPVLMVIEDMHWIDRSTRDLIRFLVHNLSDERIAIALTYRDDELPEDHPVRRLLGELLRSDRVECLRLGPLSREEIAAQVRAILDEAPPGLADEIYARSGGNPFFAEELLAARGAGIPRDEFPSTLRDTLAVRVARLGSAAAPVLRAAGAIRRPASGRLLAAVAGVEPAAVSATLRQAIRYHILVQLPGDAFGFRHDLVREVIYDDLLPDERVELHARAAAAVAVEGPGGAWGELAFHWRAARRPREALEASARAALQAERARAFAEAAGHLDCVLELWPYADQVDLPLDRQETLEHAARLARYCGDYPRAIALCRTALDELDPVADPVAAARMHELRGRCECYEEDCGLASFRRALSVLPPGPSAERARLLGAEGFALIGLHRWSEARQRCGEAVAMALETGAREEEAYARARLGLALAFTGESASGEDQLVQSRDIAQDLGLAEDLLYCHLYLGEVRRLRGRLEAAHTAMVDGEAAARGLGMEACFGRFMGLNAAADLFSLGRWEEAAARLGAVEGVSLEPWETLLYHQVEGQLAVGRGDDDAARHHLGEGRRLCEEGAPSDYLPGIFAALAEQALWRGRADEARDLIDDALTRLAGQAEPLNRPVLYSVGARACADAAEHAQIVGADAQGAAARAGGRALLDDLDALLRQFGDCAGDSGARAHRALCAAELARGAGRAAVEEWQTAAAVWRGLRVPYVAAYAEWRQAEALLSAGRQRETARSRLREALATAVQLGAEPLRRELEGLAQRARLRVDDEPAAPVDDAGATAEPTESPLGLTARELEVLALIAEGLTNRQIAQRLFISEKTAGVHVSHILAKLNVHNRLAAAGVAHRLGLAPSGSPL